jgi:hypothetical protein
VAPTFRHGAKRRGPRASAAIATKARFEGPSGVSRGPFLGTIGVVEMHEDVEMNPSAPWRRWLHLRWPAIAALLVGHLAAQAQEAAAPEVFAPGVISATGNVNAVTFSPDGSAAWFDEVAGGGSTIMESRRVDGAWTTPRIAAFSGQWRDLDPAMAPDGSFIVFCSNRPAAPGGKALDSTTFDGRLHPGAGSHLWRVDRAGSGWSAPVLLPASINDGTRLYSPSVVGDGSLYYQRPDAASHTFHLMRSQYRDGAYQPPEPVVIGPREADERDPAVAPDESFIVFSTKRPPARPDGRLVIAFRTGDHWGEPIDLGDAVNRDGAEGPHLGPDGRTIYIDSTATFEAAFPRTREQTQRDLERARLWDNGNSHLWAFSLATWLEAHR